VSFAAITLCVASRRVFIVAVYFVIDSVQKLLDTPSYTYVFMKRFLDWSPSKYPPSDLIHAFQHHWYE
jgi:hypothetical protein